METHLLQDAVALSARWLESLPTRPVRAEATQEQLRASLDLPLPEEGLDDRTVLAELADAAEPGLVASAGPRYFGFVIGGTLPVALAADWLTSAWDQNAGGYPASPASMVVEDTAERWVLELLGLPREASVGFVTGTQMAHFTCLAAARHAVLEHAGWDVDRDGLSGAPRVRLLAGEAVHVTALVALRLLGLGAGNVELVAADDQGRMRASDLRDRLAGDASPTIVCTQVGEIHTGAFDPVEELVAVCREHGAWCHVDGAFGLWAAASPALRHLVRGVEAADSWTTDGHKVLNLPFDSGMAIVADREAHRAAMTSSSAYIPPAAAGERFGYDWAPEFSRRARAFPVYAALRALGRQGVAELVERLCGHTTRMAVLLGELEGVEVVHEPVFNQLSVRFGDDDGATNRVVARVQQEGTCWMSPSTFRGEAVMRLSLCGWQTSEEDVERSVAAIAEAWEVERRV